ncbi:MAG: type II toxin-antitoxin system VapC family toxin [Deltaproteobacteria bacterium]|nr:type II toxin-antitoxin system VapC family toxin [Deltaproteobacteria bacterium]
MVAYWDSSALVALLIEEEKSVLARKLKGQTSQILTWVLTPVEVYSALCRLEKEGALSLNDFQKCYEVWQTIENGLIFVKDIEAVKNISYRLLRLHSLKAADSFQLASAILSKQANEGFPFITFDQRLEEAALKEGFQIKNLNMVKPYFSARVLK